VRASGLLLVAIPLVLLVMLTMQGRRRGRELRAAQSQVRPGAVVMTGAGMFGTVVAVENDQVTLETAPGQTSQWLRQAIVKVITPAPRDTSADGSGLAGDGAGPADRPTDVADRPYPTDVVDRVDSPREEEPPARD